jgi:hypothetical protein
MSKKKDKDKDLDKLINNNLKKDLEITELKNTISKLITENNNKQIICTMLCSEIKIINNNLIELKKRLKY